MKGKKAYVVMASGGVSLGSTMDFSSPYLKHVLGFIGIHDVEFISAAEVKENPSLLDAALAGAKWHTEQAA